MPADNRKLVTIAVFATEFEASLASGALESAGILSLVPGEVQGSLSRRRGGSATTEVQVFEDDRERAIAVLDEVKGR